MIYKISNKFSDIKSTIELIKNKHKELAFISYIDGEYGMRVSIYNSHVKNFIKDVKNINQKTSIIGICFINHSIFIKDICDDIIEIQDTKFENSQFAESNHFEQRHIITETAYSGNDGWSNYYIYGLHCTEYENILQEMRFDNILFTTHCDGTRLDTCAGDTIINHIWDQNNVLIGKINNQNYYSSYKIESPDNFFDNLQCTDVALHIRNTNKHTDRNMPKNIYEFVFDYCIANKITLHTFLDMNSVDIPKNEYIICYNDRFNNIPNMDYYMSIIKNCKVYIGVDSGFSEIVAYYTNTPNILIYNRLTNLIINSGRNIIRFDNTEDINNSLNNIFKK